MNHFTVCQYWPSATWWAVYMDGKLLDVYAHRDCAERYATYMNTPNPCLTLGD